MQDQLQSADIAGIGSFRVDVAIIGAGIVGLATAREVCTRFPGVSVVVLDKELAVGAHQTSHNSGVIHSGIYYKPGSLKARLCVEGSNALIHFCQEHGIPYEICGKVIVATSEEEIPRLEELYRRGMGNRLAGLKMICAEEIRDLEPDAVGIRGIHVPGTGIVDYGKVARKYAELVTAYGAQILLSCKVVGLRNIHSRTIIETTRGEITARFVINCAGLQSDKISQMVDANLKLKIIPFRGEYYELSPSKCGIVRGLIYPVPDPRFPFLGVHFTRRIEGGVEAGPNAVLALKREGYCRGSFAFGDVMDLATFPGFWRMAAKYWQTSVEEYYRSLSKEAFLRSLQRLVPNIGMEDLKPGGAGVRAQAVDARGKLIDDFYFVHTDGMIHVCNVPSPAATASLAIGKYIVDTAVEHAGNTLASER